MSLEGLGGTHVKDSSGRLEPRTKSEYLKTGRLSQLMSMPHNEYPRGGLTCRSVSFLFYSFYSISCTRRDLEPSTTHREKIIEIELDANHHHFDVGAACRVFSVPAVRPVDVLST
jgi:hypothetical protein